MPQPSWPEEIQQANDDLDPWGIGLLNEDVIIAFIERWGDCTPETLQRSLDAPVERASVWSDYFRIFAIFALGRLAPTGVEEVLAPFLLSPQRKERWAAVIALGRLQHEKALLLLPHLLLEGLVDDLSAFDGEVSLAIHHA